MRIIQLLAHKLLAATVVAAGVYIIAQELGYWPDRVALHVPDTRLGAYALGVVFVIVGLLALLPTLRFRRKSATIAFPGEHGDVLIHLDSVQANLNKVVGKRPEVKRSNVKLIPVSDKRRVRLEADVLLIKTPDAGARELAEKLRKFIATTAANMLGIDEVATVDLNVRGIVVDRGSVKAMVNEEPKATPAAAPFEAAPTASEAPAARAEEPRPSESVFDGFGAVPRDVESAPSAIDTLGTAPVTPLEQKPELEDDGLAPLPSWETAEPVPSYEPGDQADIATPVVDDMHEPQSHQAPPSAESTDEPRDKTFFP